MKEYKKISIDIRPIALMIALGISSCVEATTTEKFEQHNNQPVLRVSVFISGIVKADSSEIEISQLDLRLERLKAAKGVVWYYREQPQNSEPPAIAITVLDLIIKHQLPVCLSPTADFQNCSTPNR